MKVICHLFFLGVNSVAVNVCVVDPSQVAVQILIGIAVEEFAIPRDLKSGILLGDELTQRHRGPSLPV